MDGSVIDCPAQCPTVDGSDLDAAAIDAWLLLQQLPGLSAKNLSALITERGDAETLLALPEPDLKALGVPPRWLAARREALRRPEYSEYAQRARQARRCLAAIGGALLPLTDARYPALLRETAAPPPLLSYSGDLSLLERPALAMVGSRRASRSGCDTAHAFARELAAAGMVISSGLALGIDGAAHRGALAGNGGTIAVLGTGLDVPYPAAHRALYLDIAERGLLLSEFAPGSPPRPSQFPQRNRIISGLSLGVLVVEAAPRSGSLITARIAAEQNREVFAVPGSIHNPTSRGCNELIRQGAALVATAADILAELRGWLVSGPGQPVAAMDAASDADAAASAEECALLALLGFEPTPVDALLPHCGGGIGELLALLSELEMRGLVEECEGSWMRCR